MKRSEVLSQLRDSKLAYTEQVRSLEDMGMRVDTSETADVDYFHGYLDALLDTIETYIPAITELD